MMISPCPSQRRYLYEDNRLADDKSLGQFYSNGTQFHDVFRVFLQVAMGSLKLLVVCTY